MPPSSRSVLALTACVVFSSWLTHPCRAQSRGHASLIVGHKTPSEDYLEGSIQGGLSVAWGLKSWPVLMSAYVSRAQKNMVPNEAQEFRFPQMHVVTKEYGLGIQRDWERPGLRASLGAGALYTVTENIGEDPTFGDDLVDGSGLWASAGLFVPILERMHVGALLRYTSAQPFDKSGDRIQSSNEFDGLFVGGVVGWSWPGD